MRLEPTIIAADRATEVWSRGFESLVTDGNRFHLVLHVRSPSELDDHLLWKLDPRTVDSQARSLFDVANTIFPAPGRLWDVPVKDFTEHYRKVYTRLLARGPRSWGCYFCRLVEFGDGDADQLQRAVTGLSTWGRNHKAAFPIHFSSADTDRPRPLGAPCLQYVQFTVDDGALSLTAMYRSHDYYYKALGNLLGLARLLSYVAFKTEHSVGSLTCLSTYAFVDAPRAKVTRLINRINENLAR